MNLDRIKEFFKKIWEKILSVVKPQEKEGEKSHYLSAKETREIAKNNARTIRELEKRKKRIATEDEYTTTMRDDNNIVEFDDLHTHFFGDAGVVKAVDGVSFDIPKGATIGVVGESGCGKSVTSLSLMQLVQGPRGQIVSGSIRFNMGDGKAYDIAKMPIADMQKIRGEQIAMIFQEPMTSLNPVFRIGYQMDEMVLLHTPNCTKEQAKARSLEMLELVGIAAPERVYQCYPHELSGGMRQRVMIAIALSCNPRLIIADEPTTALDVTIQAQILDLLRDIKTKIDGSIMLITHDLGVIAEMADYVFVMYAGRVIERGTTKEIFENPMHPYTIGLQKSKPVVRRKVDRLYNIPGQVPNPIDMPNYCYFRDRCDKCIGKCGAGYPGFIQVSPTHSVSCYLYEDAKEEDNV
jgi:peptide/nickel transport system ATP-binding protein